MKRNFYKTFVFRLIFSLLIIVLVNYFVKEIDTYDTSLQRKDILVGRGNSSDILALTEEEKINCYVTEICGKYNVETELVESIIYYESRYQIDAVNGNCVGLMQVSTYWHADRAKKLGVTDFYDSYDNILVGVDYLSELFETYEEPELVLMVYNMGYDRAYSFYKKGIVSEYAHLVLSREKQLKGGVLMNV